MPASPKRPSAAPEPAPEPPPESPEPPAPGPRRSHTLVFALAVLLHGLAYFLVLPAWMGEDEPWHFEYARHVADGYRPWGGRVVSNEDRVQWPAAQLQVQRRFHDIPPEHVAERQREILDSMAEEHFYERVDWAGVEAERRNFDQVALYFTATVQPPLYYLLAGAWMKLAPSERVAAQLRFTRGLSLLLYLAGALAGLAFARQVFADERVALAAAACTAWIPMHARQAAVVNNDVLARTLAAFVLLLCARYLNQAARAGGGRRWELALAVALGGLGLLAKSTAAGVLGVLVLTPLFASRGLARRWRAIALALAVAAVVVGGMSVWYLQHSPVLPKNLEAFQLRASQGFSLDSLREIGRTLAGAFNWYSRNLPDWSRPVLGALAGVGLVSATVYTLRRAQGTTRRLLLLSAAAIAIQLVLVGLRGVASGRYLMPVVPALGVLLAAGFVAACPDRWRARAASFLLLLLLAYDALFLWGGLVPHQYLVWGS